MRIAYCYTMYAVGIQPWLEHNTFTVYIVDENSPMTLS